MPSVVETREAALCGVRSSTLLTSAVTNASDVRAAKTTPTPVLRVPLTDLLGRGSVLLALATASASTATTTAATSSTTPTPAATSSTATPTAASTPATSPAAAATTPTATTRPSSRATTPTASTAPTAASPAVTATTLAPFALAAAASARGRRSADLLSTKKVDSSSRGDRGKKGGRRTPLKERAIGTVEIAAVAVGEAGRTNQVGQDGAARFRSGRGSAGWRGSVQGARLGSGRAALVARLGSQRGRAARSPSCAAAGTGRPGPLGGGHGSARSARGQLGP
ncbi:unnamed protein product [Closterium sp. NIES-64]|nr:unnamed protein product [Closterium sp. NIES-64]